MKAKRKDIFPSDNEAAKMNPGHWPVDENANNPFIRPLNKKAERLQEQKAPLK